MDLLAVIVYIIELLQFYLNFFIQLLDYYLPGWKVVVLSPIVIAFIILPFLVVVYIYVCAITFHIYRRRHAIYEGFHNHSVWEAHKRMIAAFWSGHGWIWHGYEVDGLENIPNTGPVMIVYYHAAIPIDLYYFMATLYLEKERTICNVMDNFAFKIPGLTRFFQFWRCFPGPRHKVVELLNQGEVVCVSPGGVREALFSEKYEIIWGKRQGFAKAALEAKVTILPMFTKNNRQAFNYLPLGRKFFRKIYERSRLPFRPLYGGFPVKMKTYIGKPIEFPMNARPELVVQKTRAQLESMIQQYQRLPGSIIKSFIERFHGKKSTEISIQAKENDYLLSNNDMCEDNEEISITLRKNLATP